MKRERPIVFENQVKLDVVINTPAEQNIFCVKCRRMVFTRNCAYKKLRNGQYAVVSVHHECGTLMYKFTGLKWVSKKDTEQKEGE